MGLITSFPTTPGIILTQIKHKQSRSYQKKNPSLKNPQGRQRKNKENANREYL
jgi:hypothetical protein